MRRCPQQGANGAERHCLRTPQPRPGRLPSLRDWHSAGRAVRNNQPNLSQRTNLDFDTQAMNSPEKPCCALPLVGLRCPPRSSRDCVPANRWPPARVFPAFSNQSALTQAFRMRLTSGRAKTTSVIDTIIRRAATGRLPVLILNNPNNPILHPDARPDYNCRCNPGSHLGVRTLFFHRICTLAGPVERAPV